MASLSIDMILIRQLVRNGTLSADDIDQMATDLEREGDKDGAHQVRCCLLEAIAPPEHETRRSQMRLLDGGNREN